MWLGLVLLFFMKKILHSHHITFAVHESWKVQCHGDFTTDSHIFLYDVSVSDFKTIMMKSTLCHFFFFFAVFYVDRCTTEEISYIYSKEMHQVTVKICEWRMVQKTTSNSPFRLHNCFATVHIHIYFFIFGPKKSLSCCTSVMALEVCMRTRCHLDAKMFAVWLVFALHTKQ